MTDLVNAPPSKDPANDGTLQGVLNVALRKAAMQFDCQLPAQVIAYDRATNVATVKPLVQMLTTAGELVSRAQIVSVPVLSLGGGQAAIHFNIQPGDLGWIEASDRDISIFKQSMGEGAPNTVRLHNFSDSRFIPDQFAKYTLADDTTECTIQTLDGKHRIELFDDKTKITADTTTLEITPTAITGTVGAAIVSLTSSTLTVTIGACVWTFSTAGLVQTGGTVYHNSKSIGDTHQHSGVSVGINNTGQPV